MVESHLFKSCINLTSFKQMRNPAAYCYSQQRFYEQDNDITVYTSECDCTQSISLLSYYTADQSLSCHTCDVNNNMTPHVLLMSIVVIYTNSTIVSTVH